jgi:hypothetical protein
MRYRNGWVMAAKRAGAAGKRRAPRVPRKKLAPFTVRIDGATRAAIEREADQNGRTASHEAAMRLRRSLGAKEGSARVHALALLVSRLALVAEEDAGASWRKNAYVSAEIGAGIRKLLADLGASGEMQVPEKLKRAWSSTDTAGSIIDDPRVLGEWIAVTMLKALRLARQMRKAGDPGVAANEGLADLWVIGKNDGEYRVIDVAPEHDFWVRLADDLDLEERDDK